MDKSSFYKVFDMVVRSDIPLPEAQALDGAPDAEACISLAPLPGYVRESMAKSAFWYGMVSRSDMWLRAPSVHFHIRDGTYISAEMQEGASCTGEDVRVYLLGSVMGILQIQKGHLPVHGGSVLKDGKVLIITGGSGAGKSTLTTALSKDNLPFLADDVSVLRLEGERVLTLPAYPQRKLCRDAAVKLGYNPDEMVVISEERDKYAVRGAQDWCSEAKDLGMIVEIVPREGGDVEVRRVDGMKRLELLHRNLYRSFVHLIPAPTPEFMRKCLQIASHTPMYQLFRPIEEESLEAVLSTLNALNAELGAE